jgi:hypothetical protein
MSAKFNHVWLLFSLAFGSLVAASIFGALRLSDARSAALDAKQNLSACEHMRDEILVLRESELVASDGEISGALVNASILKLTSEVGVAESQVGGIQRLPAIAIEKTEYRREDIALTLAAVTVEQLVELVLRAPAITQGAVPTALSLTPPPEVQGQQPQDERWHAEVILTRLVFNATSR